MLGCEPEELGKMLYQSVAESYSASGNQKIQRLVSRWYIRPDDPDFDLYKLVPGSDQHTCTMPVLTLLLECVMQPIRIQDEHDVTIHRLCIQGKDELVYLLYSQVRVILGQWQNGQRN